MTAQLPSKSLPPRLTEAEMAKLAHTTIQDFINACNCKSKDDILLALSHILSVGLYAGEAVQCGKAEILQ